MIDSISLKMYDIAVPVVYMYTWLLFCDNKKDNFKGFTLKGGIRVLVALVPGHCILVTFNLKNVGCGYSLESS